MSGEGTTNALASAQIALATEMLAEVDELRARATRLKADACDILRSLDRCPSCGRSGAPWCSSLVCSCSESCHDLWHTVKGHRR